MMQFMIKLARIMFVFPQKAENQWSWGYVAQIVEYIISFYYLATTILIEFSFCCIKFL